MPKRTLNSRIRWAYAMHMAGCKSSISGDDFYGSYESQDIARDQAADWAWKPCPPSVW